MAHGRGPDAAISNAADLGLVTEQVGATVEEQTVGPCSYSSVENPQECREITAILTGGPEEGSLIVLPEINTEFQSGIPDLSPGDTIILGFEPATNAYFYADLDRQAPLVWPRDPVCDCRLALGRRRGSWHSPRWPSPFLSWWSSSPRRSSTATTQLRSPSSLRP